MSFQYSCHVYPSIRLLLSSNVPLGYVSTQLGHSEIAITSRYYAKWIDTEHQQPPKLGPTEVYADFLAKLGKPHHSPTTLRIICGTEFRLGCIDL